MTEFPAYDSIAVEGPDADGVVVLTLNRPEALNAFTLEMDDEFVDALRRLRNPSGVGAVVITGAGSTFSAGGELSTIQELGAAPGTEIFHFDQAVHMVRDFLTVRPPVIAAVNGHAVGLGATIALLSDVVFMAAEARIADTHIRAGIVAGDGGTFLWPLLLGPSLAKEFLMTGDPLTAAEARELRLVRHVLPAAEVLDAATALARRLARGPRHAIAWTKQAVNARLLADASLHLPMSTHAEARTVHLPDMVEGTTAFLEKRSPSWPSADHPHQED